MLSLREEGLFDELLFSPTEGVFFDECTAGVGVFLSVAGFGLERALFVLGALEGFGLVDYMGCPIWF